MIDNGERAPNQVWSWSLEKNDYFISSSSESSPTTYTHDPWLRGFLISCHANRQPFPQLFSEAFRNCSPPRKRVWAKNQLHFLYILSPSATSYGSTGFFLILAPLCLICSSVLTGHPLVLLTPTCIIAHWLCIMFYFLSSFCNQAFSLLNLDLLGFSYIPLFATQRSSKQFKNMKIILTTSETLFPFKSGAICLKLSSLRNWCHAYFPQTPCLVLHKSVVFQLRWSSSMSCIPQVSDLLLWFRVGHMWSCSCTINRMEVKTGDKESVTNTISMFFVDRLACLWFDVQLWWFRSYSIVIMSCALWLGREENMKPDKWLCVEIEQDGTRHAWSKSKSLF